MSISYKEIAREAGVSVTTVHRIMTGANRENWPSTAERAKRVRDIAEKFNFRPNAAARTMRRNKTEIIGILLRDRPERKIMDPWLFEMILGIDAVMERNNHMLNIVRIGDDYDLKGIEPRALRENLLDGLIVMGAMPDGIYEYISKLISPIVWLETNYFAKDNCIRRDEHESVALAFQGLYGKGRRRMAYVGPKPVVTSDHFSERERIDAFQKNCISHGCENYGIVNFRYSNEPGPLDDFIGRIKSMPGEDLGILAYDTMFAQLVINKSSVAGLLPGRDFGLATCDGTSLADYVCRGLGRSLVPRYDLGIEAGEMLIKLIKTGRKTVKSKLMDPKFIIGETL